MQQTTQSTLGSLHERSGRMSAGVHRAGDRLEGIGAPWRGLSDFGWAATRLRDGVPCCAAATQAAGFVTRPITTLVEVLLDGARCSSPSATRAGSGSGSKRTLQSRLFKSDRCIVPIRPQRVPAVAVYRRTLLVNALP